MRHAPLIEAISEAAFVRDFADVTGAGGVNDDDEATHGTFALVWAQGRLSCADLGRQLVAERLAAGRCDRLSFGLLVRDEEWSKCVPHDVHYPAAAGGALATLEAVTGRAVSGRHARAGALTGQELLLHLQGVSPADCANGDRDLASVIG